MRLPQIHAGEVPEDEEAGTSDCPTSISEGLQRTVFPADLAKGLQGGLWRFRSLLHEIFIAQRRPVCTTRAKSRSSKQSPACRRWKETRIKSLRRQSRRNRPVHFYETVWSGSQNPF